MNMTITMLIKNDDDSDHYVMMNFTMMITMIMMAMMMMTMTLDMLEVQQYILKVPISML